MSLNGNLNKSQFMEELQQKGEPVERGFALSSWKRLTICLAAAVQ